MILMRLLGQVYRDEAGGTGTGTGGTGTGTGAPPPTGTGTGAPPPTGTGTGAAWYETFTDPEVKTWLTNYKGAYPNAEAVAQKAYHLEKFVGAEKAGRGVVIPKDDDTPEAKQAFIKKVFNPPEKPEGYALPKETKAEILEAMKTDPGFAQFQQLAHKMGMPASMFGEVMNFFIAQSAQHNQNTEAQFEQRAEKELGDLAKEWPGVEYDKNVELGRRAARAFVPHKDATELESTLNRIEGAIGPAATLKWMANIGKAMGEHNFVEGGGSGDMGQGGMTPEAARVKISELKKDEAFGKKLLANDVGAKKEWDDLHKLAYPGVQAVR